MDDRDTIIEWVAEREAAEIGRRVVRALRRMKAEMQSGDDSGLADLWDEICVQMQTEQSVMWDHYEDVIRGLVLREVQALDKHLRMALWLQTREGQDWDWDDEDLDQHDVPYSPFEVADYITEAVVLSKAADYTNRRIARAIDSEMLARFD